MENLSTVWLKNGRILKQVENEIQLINNLPKLVYNMNFNPNKNEIFLEEYADEFKFDFKIYGLESKFIEHVMKTFNSTTGNLGMLFNGVKGTGKTVTAKIIANMMGLPIILVNSPYPGLANFIANISCPCVLLFDEFEKNFSKKEGNDTMLLSIMDGVFNSPYRRVFILTTNTLHINENFIGRPSRIRYRKSFGNLQPEVVIEYLNDNLNDKSKVKEIVEFIDTLEISTIDILKCIVEEVNIHNCPISEFKHFINVETAKYVYDSDYIWYERDEPHSIELFKETLAKVGTSGLDTDGNEHQSLTKKDLDIDTTRLNCTKPIEYLVPGEELSYMGSIISPLNEDNIIIIENNSNGDVCYIKINNINKKPSLYRNSFAF